jgi:glucose/mannose-6-phosphate isomerase
LARFKSEISNTKMYPQVARLPEHIEFALNCMVFNLRNTSKAIVCGMGTCNIAGLVVSDYLDAMKSTPLPIAKGVDLPKWVDKDTTVIVVSYSGNTVETLHLYRAAVRAGAQVVCITHGGELEELCVKDDNVMLSIPGGFRSRGALGYMIGYILLVLNNIGLLDSTEEVTEALKSVKAFRDELVSTDDNEAKTIAERIHGKVPSVYSFFNMRSVAYRWKSQFNENSKVLSFHGTMPEFNHNELMGWANDTKIKDHVPIMIFDDNVSSMLKAMAETPIGMIMDRGITVYVYHLKGNNHLEKMLKAIVMGDFVSLYLAHLNGVDPSTDDIKSVQNFPKAESRSAKRK